MSQHDYIIADASGSAFLADLNLAVKALAENNYGTTAPAVMYAHMWWADTTNDILKKRNAANTGWISYLTLSTGALLGNAATATSVTGSAVVSVGIGYATGAGGTVTQLTSKNTAVTLNKICGIITTASDALAAGADASFTFNNSNIISESDIIEINYRAPSGQRYIVDAFALSSGQGIIRIRNNSAISNSDALSIRFAIIRGVSS